MNCFCIVPFLLLGVTSQTPMYTPYTTIIPSYPTAPTSYSYDPMRGFYMTRDVPSMPLAVAGVRSDVAQMSGGSVHVVRVGESIGLSPGAAGARGVMARNPRGAADGVGGSISRALGRSSFPYNVAGVSGGPAHVPGGTVIGVGIAGSAPRPGAAGGSGVSYAVAGGRGSVAQAPVGAGRIMGNGGSIPGPGIAVTMPRMTMIGGEPGYMAIRTGLPTYGGQGQLPLI